MEWNDVLVDAVTKLSSMGIRYVVVGSCASMTYGEARMTRDVDILADLRHEHVGPLLAAFPPPDHYVSQSAIEQALRQKSMFNIVYNLWAIKVDVMIDNQTSKEMKELDRGIEIEYSPGTIVRFAAPEDVIIKKLEFFQLGGSEKHLRDIAAMLQIKRRPIDRDYIASWAAKLGTQAEWQLILDKLAE